MPAAIRMPFPGKTSILVLTKPSLNNSLIFYEKQKTCDYIMFSDTMVYIIMAVHVQYWYVHYIHYTFICSI